MLCVASYTELEKQDERRSAVQTSLDQFTAVKNSLNLPEMLNTLEANGRELAEEVARAEEEYRLAKAAVEHLKTKDDELPSQCIRREDAP